MNQTPPRIVLLVLITTLGFSLSSATASETDRRYSVGDRVPLLVNKVGPLNNPSETYKYFDLPFCRPDSLVIKKESLGEVLSGDRLVNALYDLKFREDKSGQILCHKKLKRDEIAKFRDAIINEYYFQMYCDDLPFWGFIGKLEEESWSLDGKGPKYYLFEHVQFNVFYNDDQVIETRAFSDPIHFVDITEDVETSVKFTYSVIWNATSIEFENRMDKYSRASLFPTHRQIHWFSFINSIVIMVLLMGLLMVLFMRHLKNDLKRLANGDEEEDKVVGWKYIHGDVFRCPPRMVLFSAILGTGTQLLTLVFFLFVLAFLGILYPYSRGALCTSLVVVYTLTSTISGYSTASFYNQFVETGWERSVLLAGFLYVGPLFVILFTLNTIAIFYGVTAALPFGTIVVILFVLTLVSFPLLAFGGAIGYHFRTKFQAPSATKRLPREIPPSAWYRKTPGQMFIGGLLPFSAIVLELHNFYASLWGYKIFTHSSVLLATFIILVILVAMLSVGLTYIQLTVEDHEWWWRSVLRGGSTAIFMFGFCIYFYAKSNMRGLLQLSFFFGYNACICYAFFLMLGTISFRASLVFVNHIYHAVKNE
ncbi:transmembrane 9 superfamily member 5-like [Actinidia eriantha]|uniref:transmembrane 9 superfamily member 5-like n=1 Tax=Actinidia eriantha TaxID=165200 RepID=UPI00258A53A7|nr:transmembrane 9 superfamily member 5-like [Actinidia eriantha]